MNRNAPSPEMAHRVYASFFSIVVLGSLFSFVLSSDLTVSTIPSNFRWRRNLINLYTSFRVRVGDRVFNSAVLGRDGWIFYTGEASIRDYQNTDPLKKKTLLPLQKEITQLRVDLEKAGIRLLIVIPPNKSTIYSQFVPEEIPRLAEKSRLDQFVEYMRLAGETNILDLRPVLLNASQTQDIYFKVDTHWNDIGAYYAYREILNSLSADDARLTPHLLSDYDYEYQGELLNPDLPLVFGLPPIQEEYWTLVSKFPVQETQTRSLTLANGGYISTMTGQDTALPTLLVFHDSFYSARFSLSHLMVPHFSKITGVLYTPDPEIWSLSWIWQEKPDFVIIEIVERNFEAGLSSLFQSDNQ